MEFHCVPFVLVSMLQQFQQSHLDLPKMHVIKWCIQCTAYHSPSSMPVIAWPCTLATPYPCTTLQLALGQYREINTVIKEVVMTLHCT